MAAAAHSFHNDLYIDLVYGTGADINPALILRQYKACLNPLNIQELVGSLCAHNRGALNPVAAADGNRIIIPVNFRLSHGIRLGLILSRIFTEQLPDTGNIRAVAS